MNLPKLCGFWNIVSVKTGLQLMEVCKNDFSFELKVDASLVTVTDKKADSIIRKALNRTGVPVISEETDFYN